MFLFKQVVFFTTSLSFKFAYDSEVYGETADDSEMVDALTKYDKDWYIGDDTSEQWTENVLDGTPNLLSLGQDKRTVKKLFLFLLVLIYFSFVHKRLLKTIELECAHFEQKNKRPC